MLSTNKIKVVGIQNSDWEMTDEDTGRKSQVDTCTIHYEIPLRSVVEGQSGKSRGRGVATSQIRIGKASLFDKYEDIPLPFFAELDIQKVSTGKKEIEEVVGFRPLEGYKDNSFDEKKPVQAVK